MTIENEFGKDEETTNVKVTLYLRSTNVAPMVTLSASLASRGYYPECEHYLRDDSVPMAEVNYVINARREDIGIIINLILKNSNFLDIVTKIAITSIEGIETVLSKEYLLWFNKRDIELLPNFYEKMLDTSERGDFIPIDNHS